MEGSNKIRYLEGLRGTAAMLVVLHHFMLAFYPAYYFGGDPTCSHLGTFELAYFRSPLSFLTNGNFMVTIFFVLSGYVLSHSYINSNKTETLVSSAMRRFLRLYIPVAFTLIIAFILLRANWLLGNQASDFTHSWWLGNIWPKDTSLKTFIECFSYKTMFVGDSTYDTSMWTMSIEFYGSLLVFGLLALTNNTRRKGLIFLVLSVFLYFLSNKFYVAFIIGISLNYLNKINLDKIKYRKILVVLFVITGLIMGGFPSFTTGYEQETFYKFISSPRLINDPDSIHILGATFIIAAVLLSPSIQKLFSGKIFIFLGDISFSSYLIHPLVIGTISCLLFLNINNIINNYNISVLITFLVTIPVVLIVSKIMTQLVDKPGVKFSKYIYTRFFKLKDTQQEVQS
ncbi:MAG TPA: acyltransferase [Bacteroidia bacterium]|nr:acyltransferase [Bacteroidia bacterium]